MFAFTAPGRRRNHTGDASEDAALGFTCRLRLATVTRNLASPRWAEHAVPTPPETTPDAETDPPTRDRTGTVSSTVFDDAVSTFSVASAAARSVISWPGERLLTACWPPSSSPAAATTARASSHARDTPPRHRFPVVPPPLPGHADPPPPHDDDHDDTDPPPIPVRCAVILDGHGSRPEDGTSVGPGARVVAHIARHLPRIVAQLVHLDPALLADFPTSTTDDPTLPPWYLPLLTHAVAHFKDLLNRFLDATFLVAAWDAGAALSATLHIGHDTVICANAGDCLLYALGHSHHTWTALPIWRAAPLLRPPCPAQAARFSYPPPPRTVPRRGHTPLPLMDVAEIIDRDDIPRTSSYEDALVYYPGVLREGQHAQVAQRDWRLLAAHLKPARSHDDVPGAAAMGGGVVLTSPESRKKLRLVNTVGNLAHVDVLLPRTSVYPFRVAEWGTREAAVVMVSDGVRDVFPHTQDLVEVWHAVREKRKAVELLGRWLAVPNDAPVPRRLNARIRTDVQRLGRARAPFQVVDARLQAAMDAAVGIMHRGREEEEEDDVMEVDGEDARRSWQAYCELVVHLAVVLGSRDDATCIVCAVGGVLDPVAPEEDELALYVGPELPPRAGKEERR
ncbi:hypothetical protein AMAG_05015 [Allomyces macrogynus ATCC 38327]|uniref:PPM-type phosphatase domain-containing protein n=1 Tax=Allomyces macrogynus (strain ATCC 38327) TaxID=578462 RepID=A0A0L0S6H2_ALLM3|nr:hypothetical protein AMAG_05015 [Allomyces macrogynus ATCC 38327]|eukprot:KNE58203.1 hypothetical protein AMAG_05015 [Allomyces macrogynus ATCC 38327]